MTTGVGRVARLAILAALSSSLIGTSLRIAPAAAQSADGSSTGIQNQALPPPPGTSENNVLGPNTAGSSIANPAVPPAPVAPSSSPAPSVAAPSQWLPGHRAELTVLDKIYGSATSVSATVGMPFSVRFLTVTVLACWIRPPSSPPDTAAFLQVTDSHAQPGSPPEFRGWVFQAEPALSGMNDPATDISVNGCT